MWLKRRRNNALGELRFLKRGPNLSWYVALVLFQYLKRLLMREMILTSLEPLLRRYMKILLQI